LGAFHFETDPVKHAMAGSRRSSLGQAVLFPSFPSCTWERELKFATKGPFRYSDHIGNLLEIKELPNNDKVSFTGDSQFKA
jgi:hypothetical protein